MIFSSSRSRYVRILVAVCAALFTVLVVSTPSLFAETAPDPASKTAKTRQYLELINSVFTFVQQNYVDELDPEVLYEGALKGIMDSLGDTYSSYLDKTQMRNMNDTTVGNFGGVGLSITKPTTSTPEKPAFVEVASPIEDSPGWKAGIQSGDLLVNIAGVATPDITMDEVLGLLRGKIGESVEVVVRRGKSMEFPVTLVRELIEVPTVKFGMIDEAGKKTGYIRIIEFTPKTPDRVQQALDLFKTENYEALIIDVRNNPGGLITSVADVADKFINEGPIVTTKSRLSFENSVYTASRRKTSVPEGLPIIVLINRGSASASEILAGALKDNHLAYLIGERTFGKGSVQQVVPLPNSDGVKLTMARYYTPSDSNIDKTGIPADLEILMPKLSDEEEKVYLELITSTVIADYVETHSGMTEKDITEYTAELSRKYALNPLYLRRLVKLEVYRTKAPPLYDLHFDMQLKAALEIFEKEDFSVLVKTTKTIKELQALIPSETDEKETQTEGEGLNK